MKKQYVWLAGMAFALGTAGLGAAQIFQEKDLQFKPSDNGSDTGAFQSKVNDGVIEIDFTDRTNQDNYLHIDLGKFDLAEYLPGGYLEIDAEVDRPILRIAASLSEPARFWPTRLFVEQEATMKPGRRAYRFYFDTLPAKRLKANRDHLYIFLHDIGGESKGKAKVRIHGTRLVKNAPDYTQQKNACYREQYNWRNYPELGKFYRGKYDRLVPAEALDANPFVSSVSLNGEFQKSFIGDITWKYDQLTDTSFARPGEPLKAAKRVTVPEAPVADQPGGYYLYKKNFNFTPKAGEKVYLRIGDLADSAEIYLNGERIGTQSGARKRHEWVLENGSRQTNTWGKPVKEVVKFQHFERMGIKCPFNPADLPDAEVMMLPIYTGEYPWNYAFDVTDALKAGENTLAIRLYGNPVKGWWIYRHTEDRSYKNIFGLLGDVELLVEARPAFVQAESTNAGQVAADGTVERVFSGKTVPGVKRVTVTGHDRRLELPVDGQGNFRGSLRLPAGFDRWNFTLTAFDGEGRGVGSRDIAFNGSVIELRDGRLYVNGDRFVIRGINGEVGIEWDNDRRQTRRRWLKMLGTYKQLGFNALRIEGATPQQLQDAQDYGLMVMPVYASGSCNTTEVALGNLEAPDHEFNTDAHKEMALTLSQYPNILFWNSGNENHHTAGYNDKVLMDRYLETAERYLHKFDPDRRPVTYANLDTFGTDWFFTAGQGVLGYNSYRFPGDFTQMMKEIYQETGMPVVFCEWGLTENETKGTALRKKDIAQWEKDMEAKLASMRNTEGCVGGFLYAHHGELLDVRGREFLQKVMAPFRLTREGNTIKFENQDVATLRKVSIQLVSPDNVVESEWLDELKPGRSLRIACPAELRNDASLRLEIRFETHRGLKHAYTRMVNRITEAK